MDSLSQGADGRSSADCGVQPPVRPPGPATAPIAAAVESLSSPTASLAIASPDHGSPASDLFGAAGRKAFLLGLVPHLRLDEVWMLQRSLAGLDLRTDIFGRLPPELQLIVVDYLSPVDVGCCLDVCRLWRLAFQHEGMRKALSRRCFPALTEYVQAAAAAAWTDTTRTWTAEDRRSVVDRLFAETARKYAIRALGRFRYVFQACQVPSLSLTVGPQHDGGHIPAQAKLYWFRQTRRRPGPRRHHQGPHQQDGGEAHEQGDVLGPSGEYDRGGGDDDNDGRGPYGSNDNSQVGKTALDLLPNYSGFEYAYGRLAWQYIMTDGTSFLVDNLRDGRRLHCKIPNSALRGEAYICSALGDEILVASTGLRLHAWHFESDEHCTVQMPAQVDVVATLDRRICILSLGNVYCWDFGGKVQQADMSGLDAKHLQPDRDGRLPSYFLLDPLHKDVFYLGNFDIETDAIGFRGDLCFYVHRFQGLRYRETFSHRLPFREATIPAMLIENTVRRNVRGLYSLAAWRVSSRSASSSTGRLEFADSFTVHVDQVESVSFNIYTHTFSESSFKIPKMMIVGRVERHTLPVHIWNDQLLTVVDRHRETPGNKVRRSIPLLFAFDDKYSEAAARSPAKPFSTIPLYTGQPPIDGDGDGDEGSGRGSREGAAHSRQPDGPSDKTQQETNRGETTTTQFHPMPQRRRRMGINELARESTGAWKQADEDWIQNNCLLRYALDIGQTEPDPETARPVHVGSFQLQGDDDFLVFGLRDKYTVWSFGEDVVENSSNGEQ